MKRVNKMTVLSRNGSEAHYIPLQFNLFIQTFTPDFNWFCNNTLFFHIMFFPLHREYLEKEKRVLFSEIDLMVL